VSRAHGAAVRRALVACCVGGAALGAAAAVDCTGRLDHAFGGYAYDPTLSCLEASGAIDVIAGADPGQCAMLRCWLAPDGSIYVTDAACDAPPDYVDETDNDFPACVKALALYNGPGHTLCPMPDGGGGAPSACGP
jgi:hypothetical protein